MHPRHQKLRKTDALSPHYIECSCRSRCQYKVAYHKIQAPISFPGRNHNISNLNIGWLQESLDQVCILVEMHFKLMRRSESLRRVTCTTK
jgi:hypothetical protein